MLAVVNLDTLMLLTGKFGCLFVHYMLVAPYPVELAFEVFGSQFQCRHMIFCAMQVRYCHVPGTPEEQGG